MAHRFSLPLDVILPGVIGIASAFVAVGIYDAELYKERRLMAAFNDFLRALAALIAAAAWPIVVLIVLARYRDRVGELIVRVRELFGAKFDPPPAPQAADTGGGDPVEEIHAFAPPAAATAQLPAVLESARTPTVLEMEQAIRSSSMIAAIQDPNARATALLTFAAMMVVSVLFERIEGVIWASHLRLLSDLNGSSAGFAREEIRARFYEPAKAQYPVWYTHYPFDHWLGFLVSHQLLNDGPVVTLTDHGREYLVWRVRQGKPMKAWG